MHMPPARRRPRALLASALLLLLPCTLPAQASSRAGEPISRRIAEATFDSAWSRIRATHYDTAMNGVDWNAVRDSLRPRAASARTMGQLRTTISAMLATLRESHFVLIPQEAADAIDPDRSRDTTGSEPGDVGLELRLLGDTVVVSRVRRGSPAERAGVQPGWIVDSVGRFSAARARTTMAAGSVSRRQLVSMIPASAASQFAGDAGTPVHAVFSDATGRTAVKRLIREPLPGMPVRFGNLPTMFVRVVHEQRPLDGRPGCAGVIRLTAWMLPATAQLDSAMDAVRHCEGIVIDVRGNPGGVGAMVMGFGGHFLDTAAALGVMTTRGRTLRFVANPRRADTRHQPVRPFAGPLAIVVDSLSMSTSEIFAAGLQAAGRAHVVGENTPGLALPAVLTRLPTGDVLMHVFADFTDPNGRRIEGQGVVPDLLVPLTRRDLLAGRDAPLEAAVAWIAAREHRAQSGVSTGLGAAAPAAPGSAAP